ncbi:MAG: vanadium-dependent haloperoxidase [Chitinophagaceae bacterium]|nr:vanadium-dependent haloperoxidase [Chitinophagaceae bacterium]
MKSTWAGLSLCVLLIACNQKEYTIATGDPLLYSKTVKRLNDIVLENNFPPMIASRNYVYANIAAYECIVSGDSTYHTLAGLVKHMPAMPKAVAGKPVDFSLAALLAFTKVGNAVTFPEGSMMEYYQDLLKKAEDAGMPEETINNSKLFSDEVANAVLTWSKKDNYAQTRSASKYTVTDEEGRWVPTPPMYASAIEAHWMEIRPLVLDSANTCMAVRPPKYNMKDSTSDFYKSAMEVKKIGDSLTEEEKHIADFWDDNPFNMNVHGHVMFATKKFSPPGHWMNIVGIASQKAKSDFNATVHAYTKTAIALFDGFINCWDEKFRSNVVRPETVINKYINPDWRPHIQTPPFPSYVSGHSVVSAAAAEVLTDIYGDNFSYTDTSELEFGIPNRSFTSFRQAAWEASVSRLFGGIHYRFDLDEGNKVGKQLGEMVVNRLRMKIKSTETQLSKKTN